jgi:hypothetical protein
LLPTVAAPSSTDQHGAGRYSNERQLRLARSFDGHGWGAVPHLERVVEFEQTAQSVTGGHRWRYELRPVDGGTEVTETFDW